MEFPKIVAGQPPLPRSNRVANIRLVEQRLLNGGRSVRLVQERTRQYVTSVRVALLGEH